MSIPKVKSNTKNKFKIYRNEIRFHKKKIAKLQNKLQLDLPNIEKIEVEKEIKTMKYKLEVHEKKLKQLGFKDNRGRPRKLPSEKYTATRSKFTAMLSTENLDYLKQLKYEGRIDNISAFLDELIKNYKTNIQQKKSPI